MQVVSKQEFAQLAGVSPSCVSEWIARRKISGEALVGRGCRARICVDVAREQLRQNVDVDQRLGVTPWAKLDAPAMPEPPEAGEAKETIEGRIKLQRLEQIALANAAAREEAAARSGHYVKAEDARQELGRVASKLMTLFESSLPEIANAIIAQPPASSQEALRLLRASWRSIRARNAKAISEEAVGLPALMED
jgi:hypothetical protein